MVTGCRIELFGGLRVILGERTISRFRTQKTAALLAYLAYHRERAHAREALIEMLWAWASPGAGRQSLSQALSSLRHQLEPPGMPSGAVLVADRTSVWLSPETVTTDVSEFEVAVRDAGRAHDKTVKRGWLEEAARLYRGELLPGLYEPWIPAEQVRLSEEFAGTVVELARLLAARGEAVGALSLLRRAIEAEPLREDSYRELMRLRMERGERGAAIEAYHELEHVLREELGEKPSAATRQLAREAERLGAEPSTSAGAPSLSGAQPTRHRLKAELPSGTVTLLMVRMEEPTSGEPYDDRPLREEFRRHGGAEIEVGGSEIVVAFGRAGDAVSCAAVCQVGAVGRSAGHARTGLAMAIHTAELGVGSDGVYPGGTLDRARRLLGAGHPAQVLCSEATAGLLRYDLNGSLRLRDLGVYRLRGASASERVFQLDYPGGPEAFAPLSAESGATSHLPLRLTRFFGRRREIEQLAAMLTGEARLVTLIGAPGCGKTRLAVEVAGQFQELFQGNVWFVPLADLRDEGQILDRALDPLGIPRSPQSSAVEQIVAAMAEQHALLVFDNFEHLTTAAPEVGTLLERLPALRCLVTSRRRLGMTGEREFPVGPLPTPSAAPLQDLLHNESVQLFVDRAQTVKQDFQLTAGNAGAVVELCRRLEGVPLAIELAAARSQALGLTQILERLEKGEDLVSRTRGTEDRHHSLRAAVEWSYELLTPELQRFLARLSVFRGGWTAEAAEAVCEEPLALDYLVQLAECSLVRIDQGPEEPRFQMPDMVRQFAGERLVHSGQEGLAGTLHFDYFHKLAERLPRDLTGPQQDLRLDRVQADLDNFLAAMDSRAAGENRTEDQVCIACSLQAFWDVRNLTLGRAVLTDVLQRDHAAVPAYLRGSALGNAGILAYRVGDYTAARSHHEESMAIRRALGDRRGLAGNLSNLAVVAIDQGDYTVARSLLEEALAINRELGNRHWEGVNLNNLGVIALNSGEYSLARSYLEAALVIHRDLGIRRSYAVALGDLGDVAARQGDYARAREMLEESLAIHRELGDRLNVAVGLGSLAALEIRTGNRDAARLRLVEKLELIRELGLRSHLEGALREAARVACQTPDGALASPATPTAQSRATRLHGAAEALRKAHGTSIVPENREAHERFVAGLRDGLGEGAFGRAWEEGRAMTFEEAVAYALAEL